MEPHRHCPACGRPLAADAPHGLCPACLLAQALPPTAPSPGARAWEPPAPEELDELLPEHEALEFVGRGGMGAVYRARHLRLGRAVAIKVLPPVLARDPAFRQRFEREARALASLQHPNIVAIHDYGEAGELCYLVMEYVDGVDLRRLLQQGRVKPEHALEILPQLCAALRYAHGRGLVHRDIKPENILLDETGQAKITDFGLARLLGGGRGEPSLTASDVALGSVHYMAPEQLCDPSRVDQRADIYSLGVVLYEMLTGHLPLGRFPRPSEEVPVGPWLDAAVLRALEHDPERRFRDAEELAHAAGGGQPAPPASRRRPAELPPPAIPARPLPGRRSWRSSRVSCPWGG